jgi:hypothetical protein
LNDAIGVYLNGGKPHAQIESHPSLIIRAILATLRRPAQPILLIQ